MKNMYLTDYNSKDVKKAPSRDGYGTGAVIAGKRDKNVVVLCCDLFESTRSHLFQKQFPKRAFEIGVAEQNMMGIGAGMSFMGKVPFVSSYAVFSPGRNWDQLRVNVCYSEANVKVVGAHAGVTVGADGATHQALEDIAITRVLPNLTVVVPCDAVEAEKATVAIAKKKGPCYIRLGRSKVPIITTKRTPFKLGQANILRQGKDVTLIACGTMVYKALLAADILAKDKIKAQVINLHTIKPIDEKTILAAARKTGAFVCAEEHQVHGGMGSAVAEVLAAKYPIPIEFVAVPDRFGLSGDPEELLKYMKLTPQEIARKAKLAKRRK